jgi:hypothetical protein
LTLIRRLVASIQLSSDSVALLAFPLLSICGLGEQWNLHLL